jgi:hypothetical protein
VNSLGDKSSSEGQESDPSESSIPNYYTSSVSLSQRSYKKFVLNSDNTRYYSEKCPAEELDEEDEK